MSTPPHAPGSQIGGLPYITPPRRSPTGVSSRVSPSDPHFIEPLEGDGDVEAMFHKLKMLVRGMKRTTVREDAPDRFAFAVGGRLPRFPDICHCEVARTAPGASGGQIHFKFEAQRGVWDLGRNRRRAEILRIQLRS